MNDEICNTSSTFFIWSYFGSHFSRLIVWVEVIVNEYTYLWVLPINTWMHNRVYNIQYVYDCRYYLYWRLSLLSADSWNRTKNPVLYIDRRIESKFICWAIRMETIESIWNVRLHCEWNFRNFLLSTTKMSSLLRSTLTPHGMEKKIVLYRIFYIHV